MCACAGSSRNISINIEDISVKYQRDIGKISGIYR